MALRVLSRSLSDRLLFRGTAVAHCARRASLIARRGLAILHIVLCVLVIIVIALLAMSGVLRQERHAQQLTVIHDQSVFLAEGAVEEAVEQLVVGMNQPASPWYAWFRGLAPVATTVSVVETAALAAMLRPAAAWAVQCRVTRRDLPKMGPSLPTGRSDRFGHIRIECRISGPMGDSLLCVTRQYRVLEQRVPPPLDKFDLVFRTVDSSTGAHKTSDGSTQLERLERSEQHILDHDWASAVERLGQAIPVSGFPFEPLRLCYVFPTREDLFRYLLDGREIWFPGEILCLDPRPIGLVDLTIRGQGLLLAIDGSILLDGTEFSPSGRVGFVVLSGGLIGIARSRGRTAARTALFLPSGELVLEPGSRLQGFALMRHVRSDSDPETFQPDHRWREPSSVVILGPHTDIWRESRL